jgi:glycosyltransferase involved in cell wall biosynthesis
MDEWKGIDDLLAACRTLGERGVRFQLTLAGPPGTAGDAPTLQAKIRDHNLEGVVRYAGPVMGDAKSELLGRADVYVQPSHHEGMPIALLEALAHGLPVVATRVGSVVEVITQRETGLLVPPRQPDRLAGAMHELASDPGLREAMSRAAWVLATRRFCTARLQRDLISLYDTLMAQQTRAVSTPVPAKTNSRAAESNNGVRAYLSRGLP